MLNKWDALVMTVALIVMGAFVITVVVVNPK